MRDGSEIGEPSRAVELFGTENDFATRVEDCCCISDGFAVLPTPKAFSR